MLGRLGTAGLGPLAGTGLLLLLFWLLFVVVLFVELSISWDEDETADELEELSNVEFELLANLLLVFDRDGESDDGSTCKVEMLKPIGGGRIGTLGGGWFGFSNMILLLEVVDADDGDIEGDLSIWEASRLLILNALTAGVMFWFDESFGNIGAGFETSFELNVFICSAIGEAALTNVDDAMDVDGGEVGTLGGDLWISVAIPYVGYSKVSLLDCDVTFGFWIALGAGGGAGAIFLLRSRRGLMEPGSAEFWLGDDDDLFILLFKLFTLLILPTLFIELFEANISLLLTLVSK